MRPSMVLRVLIFVCPCCAVCCSRPLTDPATGLKVPSVIETPLLMAIGSHQEQVVKALLAKGVDVNEPTVKGELPLARNLGSVTVRKGGAVRVV